tara:strand:+ start:573 stop:695 length:123 start_codon:yes stop_codon:yes gene_type:complete
MCLQIGFRIGFNIMDELGKRNFLGAGMKLEISIGRVQTIG